MSADLAPLMAEAPVLPSFLLILKKKGRLKIEACSGWRSPVNAEGKHVRAPGTPAVIHEKNARPLPGHQAGPPLEAG